MTSNFEVECVAISREPVSDQTIMDCNRGVMLFLCLCFTSHQQLRYYGDGAKA